MRCEVCAREIAGNGGNLMTHMAIHSVFCAHTDTERDGLGECAVCGRITEERARGVDQSR